MSKGWAMTDDGAFLIPTQPPPPAAYATREADLSRLAEYVVFLHEKTSTSVA